MFNFFIPKPKLRLLSVVIKVPNRLFISPLNFLFLETSVIIFTTPPRASEPYKLDDAPFTISICLILFTVTLLKSRVPAERPTSGTPSINIKVY